MGSVSDEIRRNYENTVLLLRLKAGYKTQKALASRIGFSPSILCEIESNQRFLSSVYALRIAEVLGCTVDDLFTKKPTSARPSRGVEEE